MDVVALLSRWIHIGTAVVLVGGTCFLRFVLAPAAAQLSETEHAKLRQLVMQTWKKFVHGGIALFLISGLYNYLVVMRPLHQGDKAYHMLMGIKILLALVIFFIGSALVGRSKAFEGMRAKAKFWQLVIVILSAVVIGISGYAKVALPGKTPTTEVTSYPSRSSLSNSFSLRSASNVGGGSVAANRMISSVEMSVRG